MRHVVVALLLLGAPMVVAELPEPAAAETVVETPTPDLLSHTFDSVEEMTRAALEVVASGDIDALRQLAVTRDEFRDFVWSGLDASRPERNLPWEFVWSQHAMRHERGLKRAVALFGEAELEFAAIDFTGGVSEHGHYRIHRQSLVEVHRPDGSTDTVRIFASVLEADGRFKIYSFITD